QSHRPEEQADEIGVDRPDTVIQPAQDYFGAYHAKHAQADECSDFDRADTFAHQVSRGMLDESGDGCIREKHCRADEPERYRPVSCPGSDTGRRIEWFDR